MIKEFWIKTHFQESKRSVSAFSHGYNVMTKKLIKETRMEEGGEKNPKNFGAL